MYKRIMFSMLLVLLFSCPIYAHDAWVEKRDGEIVVLYGHAEDHRFDPYDPAKVKEARGFDRDGKDVTVKIVKGKDRASISPEKEVTAITIFFDNGYWVKTPERWRSISKREAKKYIEAGKYIESMYVRKFGKTLFGWNDRFSKPLGMGFEIVPLKNPFGVKTGGSLPIKVLYEGKPLEGAKIKVMGHGRKSAPNLVTDKEGMIDIAVEKTGIHIISARHRIPLKDDPDADFLVFRTTLTFEVK